MLKLYDYELSGNCYKIRLFLNMLDQPVKLEMVDFYPGNEHKKPPFLRINPLGQLPVLEDGDFRLRDAQAILTYLPRKYDTTGQWYPVDNPRVLGEVGQWLAFADMITGTASAARLHDAMFYEHIDAGAARNGAHRLLRVLDEHLWVNARKGQDWICSASHPTIADIANFPYIMMSRDGDISLQDYPAVRRWTDRVKRLPGFIVMPGIFPAGPAANSGTQAVA
jgi:glutathione S-transferase